MYIHSIYNTCKNHVEIHIHVRIYTNIYVPLFDLIHFQLINHGYN